MCNGGTCKLAEKERHFHEKLFSFHGKHVHLLVRFASKAARGKSAIELAFWLITSSDANPFCNNNNVEERKKARLTSQVFRKNEKRQREAKEKKTINLMSFSLEPERSYIIKCTHRPNKLKLTYFVVAL